MQSELMNKINNYKNPYIALAQSLQNNHHEQGQGIVDLLRFITKNSKDDVNEFFFNISQKSEYVDDELIRFYKIERKNILDVLVELRYEKEFGWDTGKPKELFVLLEKAGFLFTRDSPTWLIKETDYHQIKEINNKEDFVKKVREIHIEEYKQVNNPIFVFRNAPEEKTMALLSHTFTQMFPEDFAEKVSKYRTLHNAVKSNNREVIKFLVEGCNIDINIKDSDLATPLFYCETLDTLNIINQYKLDWFNKDTANKECLSYFASLEDKEESRQMIRFTQQAITDEISNNPNNGLPSNYLQERIRNSLLEMVQSDRTKKELEDFMKKNNVTSVSDIFDENGNSLAQICLMKNNWARYNIFKNHYPLEHVNNSGKGSLEIIFSLRRVSHERSAKPIFDELLLNGVQYKNGDFSLNLLKEYFKNSSLLELPTWYMNLEEEKKDNFKSFADLLIGEKYSQKFIEEYKQAKHTYSEERKIKAVAYLLLTHTVLYSKNINFDLPLDGIFYENKGYYKNEVKFMLDKNKLTHLLSVIDVIEQNQHLHKVDYSSVWSGFEKAAVEHLLKSYSKNKEKISAFVQYNEYLMNELADRGSNLFISILNEEFVENIRINKELGIKLEYALLSRETSLLNNVDKNKKVNKI
jgi:hypothetical protein